MGTPIESMERMEREYWGAVNQFRIKTSWKRYSDSDPPHDRLVEAWNLYAKTKVLEDAYGSLSKGETGVYKPHLPVLDVLTRLKRQPHNEQNIAAVVATFHQDMFGTGDKGKSRIATYLGTMRGSRRRRATNFFYSMEDMLKEEVADVEFTAPATSQKGHG